MESCSQNLVTLSHLTSYRQNLSVAGVVKSSMEDKARGKRKIRQGYLRLLAALRVYDFRQAYDWNSGLSANLYFYLGGLLQGNPRVELVFQTQ